MRQIALTVVCLLLVVIAMRNWYKALCGLILLAILAQHPSMPSQIGGIPGANPFNLVLGVIGLAWLINRLKQPLSPSANRLTITLIVAYVTMLLAVGIAGVMDAGSVQGYQYRRYTASGILMDGVANPLKYLMVGILFFDGSNTRNRVKAALLCAIASCVGYASLMWKSIGSGIVNIDVDDARRLTDKLIGLYANDLGQLFAFAVWAALIVQLLHSSWLYRAAWLCSILVIGVPIAVLKSRTGYLCFCAVGLALGVVRWRSILVILPMVALGVVVFVPSVAERALDGVGLGAQTHDWDTISAGRMTNLWPPVMQQIEQAPFFGHGRYSILRTKCFEEIFTREGIVPTHPHNAYLEIMLDAGVIGLAICLVSLAGIGVVAVRLMHTIDDPLARVAGGVSLAAVVTVAMAGITGYSFYPSQSMLPYLCVWGVTLRLGAAKSLRTGRLQRFPIASRFSLGMLR